MSKKILFLVPYPLEQAPSQRFRFEQYFSILKHNGFTYSVQSFLSTDNWQLFFKPGNPINKAWALLSGFVSRLGCIATAKEYEFIFIHREVAPIGPPVFEWVLAKILKKKIIYDFDDAIWLTDRSREPALMRILKWRSKVKYICKWSFKVSCGNDYLCDFARNYNERVVLNRTTIDTQHRHNPDLFQSANIREKITIGWTGSHSTLKYLEEVEPVLQKIEREFPVIQVLVIADQKPDLNLRFPLFIPWNEKTEIEDLLKFDIGIMPLPDHEWAKGKCGFKALQYMALRIPAVVSPVGVNVIIIDDGENGFLCSTLDEWEQSLTTLIRDTVLRKKMGESGRRKVINHYSVLSNSSNFLSLFE